MRFAALPGDSILRDPAIIPSEHGVAIDDVYFKSPTLRWEKGTHCLVSITRMRSRQVGAG